MIGMQIDKSSLKLLKLTPASEAGHSRKSNHHLSQII